MGKFIKVAGGWKNTKKGHTIKFDKDVKADTKLQMFDNDKGDNPKRPDVVLGYFEDDEKKVPDSDIPFN